jgi:predicted secreted protein
MVYQKIQRLNLKMKNIAFIILISSCIASCDNTRTINTQTPQPLNIQLNEKIRINLPEDHTTGYTWQLNDSYDKTIIDHYNSVWEGNKNGVMIYLRGTKKGTTVLNFTSRKYDDVNSIQEFTINVN